MFYGDYHLKNKYLGLAKKACFIASSKKASDPVILNIRRLSAVADYMVIASGESSPQIHAIIDGIYRSLRDEHCILPLHWDGRGSDSWSAIDYGGLIVHIMSASVRKLYALEKVWHGAVKVSQKQKIKDDKLISIGKR